jgi:subtilisin family serine protease
VDDKMNNRSRLAVVVLVLVLVSASELSAGQLGQAEQPVDDGQIVVVYLRNQEQSAIAQAVHAEYEPRQRELARMVQFTYYAEQRMSTSAMVRARLQAANVLDAVRRSMRLEILARSESARQESQARVASGVAALGGEVLYRYRTINALAIAIPAGSIETLKEHPDVAEVYEDRLMQGHMNISPAAIGAPTWWSQGYTGGATDVAVLDSGVDNLHPALDPQLIFNRRCLATADAIHPEMPGWDPSADDLNGHGTHVAGTVAMTNTVDPYLGVAHGLDVLLNGKAGFNVPGLGAYMYWSDGMACADWAIVDALDDAEVINLSYGGTAFSDDGGYERFWDAVVDQMDVVVTISAGNDGSITGTLNSPSIAYNVLSVANVWDQGTTTRADDYIWWSSSRGPTPGGRRKPDVAAPGAYITSANDDWEGGTPDYVAYTGTSMAAPHVAGAAALLMDRGIVSPMAVKALLINSAEDLGPPGWDISYGWGYIDLIHLDSGYEYFSGSTAASPAYQLYVGPSTSGDTATLVWHRRAVYADDSYPSTYYSLTDLDLYAYNEVSDGSLDESYSAVDNVEQVTFDGTYSTVIKVDAWSSSIDGALFEDYVLATEPGFSVAQGPAFSMDLDTAGDIGGLAGEFLTVTLVVTNTGDLRAHGVTVFPEYSTGLQLTSAQTMTVGQMDPTGTVSGLTWTFTKTTDIPQAVWLWANSDSYDELFTAVVRWGGREMFLPLITRNP